MGRSVVSSISLASTLDVECTPVPAQSVGAHHCPPKTVICRAKMTGVTSCSTPVVSTGTSTCRKRRKTAEKHQLPRPPPEKTAHLGQPIGPLHQQRDLEFYLPGSQHQDLSAGNAEPDRHAAPGGAAYPGEALSDDPVFGFLANRVCGRRLPWVYEALRMEGRGKAQKLYFAQMSTAFLHRDLFSCVLCGARMVYNAAIAGLIRERCVQNLEKVQKSRFQSIFRRG